MPTDLLEYAIPVAIFLLVATGFFSLIYRLLEERKSRRQRAAASTFLLNDEGSKANLVLGDLTPALAAQIPLTAGDEEELRKELKTAGYHTSTALLEYTAVRTTLFPYTTLSDLGRASCRERV